LINDFSISETNPYGYGSWIGYPGCWAVNNHADGINSISAGYCLVWYPRAQLGAFASYQARQALEVPIVHGNGVYQGWIDWATRTIYSNVDSKAVLRGFPPP
jgi:hypothetical protein